MKQIILQFRAKLPSKKYFYQKNQYLTSFLRRVLLMWEVTHPTYLKEELEDKLELLINKKWVKCVAPGPICSNCNDKGFTTEYKGAAYAMPDFFGDKKFKVGNEGVRKNKCKECK